MTSSAECQMPAGCLYVEEAGACPLCDEDGADRIADWFNNQDENECVKDQSNG